MASGKDRSSAARGSWPEASDNELEFAVVANGVDFLETAISHLEKGDNPRDLKHAVLDLQAAVEILVKVRLQREGIEHVFDDPYSVDADKYARGDFRSVTLDAALQRLDKTAGIMLSKEHRKALGYLGKERNKLQHFGSTSNREVVTTHAATALDVLSQFIRQHLVPDTPPDEAEFLERAVRLIRDARSTIAAFRNALLTRITPELDEWKGIVILCPACLQEAWTFQPHDDASRCRYCDHDWSKVDGRDAAEEYVASVLGETRYEAAQGRSGWSVTDCPECEMEAFVWVATRDAPDSFPATLACFHCGFTTTDGVGTCGKCERTISDPEDVFCDDCREYILTAD